MQFLKSCAHKYNVCFLSQISGAVVIMDFDGLSMKQVMGLSPAFSMRLLSFIQDALPLRLKEVRTELHLRTVSLMNQIKC